MKIKIKSDIKNLRLIETKVDELLIKHEVKNEVYGKILVATMEAVNNAIIHGNRTDSSKEVIISFEYNDGRMIVSVEDEGTGFNPEIIPDPTAPENIEKLNGRGVFLMKKLSDEISFNERGNEVIMKFIVE